VHIVHNKLSTQYYAYAGRFHFKMQVVFDKVQVMQDIVVSHCQLRCVQWIGL